MDKKKKFIINTIFYFLIIIMILGVCKYILPVMLPFVVAFLIASVLQLPIRKICRHDGKKKKAASVLICVAFFVLMFLCAAGAGVKIFNSISGFLKSVPVIYQEQLVPLFSELFHSIRVSDPGIAESIESIFQECINNLGNYITDFSMNAVKFVSGGIVSIPGVIVKLVIMIVSTFFFVVDYDKIIDFFVKCVPKERKGTLKVVQGYVKNTVMVYLKSYTLLFLLTYVELCIGFKLIGIPYPLTVGLIVAVFDILPILGTGGILLPWAVILLMMKEIPMAVGMVVLYIVITVIRNTIEPRLVGMQIGLHPLATLISMYLGLKLIGIIGMILFPVTLAVLINMKRNVPA